MTIHWFALNSCSRFEEFDFFLFQLIFVGRLFVSFFCKSCSCSVPENGADLLGASVEVLADPSQAFSVALALEDRTHEQFERPTVELGARDFALPGRLSVEAESLTKLLFGASSGPVDLVAQDEDGAVGQLLVGQEGVELGLGLDEPGSVADVDQEDDGVDGREVVTPDLKRSEAIISRRH